MTTLLATAAAKQALATSLFGNSLLYTLVTLVLIPVLVAGLTAVVTLLVTNAGEARDRRRDHYAQAVKTLVAWSELPYRVRRRTDDDPATLSALANLGHDLQEQLACHGAWIAADHPRLARSYTKARAAVSEAVGPAISEAWNSPPVRGAAGMNLGSWGPGRVCRAVVTELQAAISSRFGVRRLRHWRSGAPKPTASASALETGKPVVQGAFIQQSG
ncbi:MAG TPA: hypothetical protein VL984_15780 [Acidimicrobiales bacterium]|nr:hypothetical protein [Acidimicrobiales bacterium]